MQHQSQTANWSVQSLVNACQQILKVKTFSLTKFCSTTERNSTANVVFLLVLDVALSAMSLLVLSFKFSCKPPYNVTTLFKIASSTSFVVFSSASTLGSSKLVLILLHFTSILCGPSARSETTLSRPRGIQRRLADTSDSNHSRLVNALRAAYTTSAHTRCGCPDAVPLNLRRRRTEA